MKQPTVRKRMVDSLTSETPVQLSVTEYGDPSAAVHVVLMHGFPDDQSMWVPVIEHLDPAWHVITYDVRGSGDSSRPQKVSDYRSDHLVTDLVSVIEACVAETEVVHLVGHDWGSVIGWDALGAESADPRLRGRIASYTSASGPSLDHVGALGHTVAGGRKMLPQVMHSWYVWMFQLPWVPGFSWRRMQPQIRRTIRRVDPTADLLDWGPRLAGNAEFSVNLYRANVLQRLARPRAWRTSVPVRLLIATKDAFVTQAAVAGMRARCRDLDEVEIDEGHWLPRARPEEFASHVTEWVRTHSG